MSCYLVSSDDIGQIAALAFRRGLYSCQGRVANQVRKVILEYNDAEEVAEVLAQQNIASCEARYPGDVAGGFLDSEAEAEQYVQDCKDAARRYQQSIGIQPLAACKLISTYNYQACETDDWVETDAYWICHAIKNAQIAKAIKSAGLR